MIKEVTMYTAECDDCGCAPDLGDFTCVADKSTVEEWASESGWYFTHIDKKCYCENCSYRHLV